MKTEKALGALKWRGGLLISVFTLATVINHFVDSLDNPIPAIIAVTAGVVSVFALPVLVHGFLAHFHHNGLFSRWMHYSKRAFVFSLASLISYFLIDQHPAFAIYFLVASGCSLVSSSHLLGVRPESALTYCEVHFGQAEPDIFA